MVSSVRELADGRILVADERENTVVVVDLTTKVTTKIGRNGSGPGEYRQVGRLWPMGADSTLLADRWAHRWLLLVGARIARSIEPHSLVVQAAGGGRLLGADALGNVIVQTSPSLRSDSVSVVRVNRATAERAAIAKMTSWEARQRATNSDDRLSTSPRNSSGDRYAIPLIDTEQIAVFADGWVAIARNNPYRVDWCRPRERCRAGPTIQALRPEMTQEAKQMFLDFVTLTKRSVGGFRRVWPLERTVGWPATLPPFVEPPLRLDASALAAAPDGRLLVHRLASRVSEETRYDVVNRRGNTELQLTLARDQRVVGFGMKCIYIVSVDADGVQRISRHAWE